MGAVMTVVCVLSGVLALVLVLTQRGDAGGADVLGGGASAATTPPTSRPLLLWTVGASIVWACSSTYLAVIS